MSTPRYVAVKTGDQFELVRTDPDAKATDGLFALSGALLMGAGMINRGSRGFLMLLAGATMVCRGVTGKNPLRSLMCNARGQRDGESPGPSFQHDHKLESHQEPADEIDEAAMESFPASDPPASARPTASVH